jgi:predicted kinase
LPFYKLYRAVVRGKVEAFRSVDPQCALPDRQQATKQARAYFRLARGLLVRGEIPPTLFLLCGLMGCGKTTLAQALAFELGLPIIRSDVLRKELLGIPPQTRQASAFSAGIYTEELTRQTYAALAERAAQSLAAGASVIVDASFASTPERERFAALATTLHVPHYILYLCGDDDLHRRRLQIRSNTGIDASDGRLELFDHQKQHFSPPAPAEFVLSLDAAKPPELLVADIYHALNLAGW